MMYMKKLLILFFLACLIVMTGTAQRYQYSQYNYALMRVNPASISLSDYAIVSSIYRSQQSVTDVQLNSLFLSAKYPIIARNGGSRWSSVGVSFAQDNAGLDGVFETDELGLTYAFNFDLTNNQTFNVGFTGDYRSRKVNTDNLTTGSQFVPGLGFDQGIDSGEDFTSFNGNYVSLGAGAVWQQLDDDGKGIARLGVSFFDLNTPVESLLPGMVPLPVTMVGEAGYRLYSNRTISVYGEVLYARSSSTQFLNIGAVTSYDLGSVNRDFRGQFLRFQTKYLLNEGVMLGIQWQKDNFSIGTSYDIPINDAEAHQGAFEIGFELGKLIESQNKSKKRKKKKRKRNRRKRNKKTSTRRPNTSRYDSLAQAIEEPAQVDTLGAVESVVEDVESSPPQSEPIAVSEAPLSRRLVYGFEFASPEPQMNTEQILDEIKAAFVGNPNAHVEIIGHTDDVGPEAFNQRLSEERAKSLRDILVEAGLDPSRVSYSGRGESLPLNDNSTDEQRARNRRVEVVVIRR